MQRIGQLPTGIFATGIESITKNLKSNLIKFCSVILISFIVLKAIIRSNAFKNLLAKAEIKNICKHTKCDPDHLVKISYERFKELKDFSFNELGASLGACSKRGFLGNVFFYDSKGFENLAKAIMFSGELSHLEKARRSHVYYFDSLDPIFNAVRKTGVKLNCLNIPAVLTYNGYIESIMKKRATDTYGHDAVFATVTPDFFYTITDKISQAKNVFLLESIEDPLLGISKKRLDQFDCCREIGRSKSKVYIALKPGTMKKYSNDKYEKPEELDKKLSSEESLNEKSFTDLNEISEELDSNLPPEE